MSKNWNQWRHRLHAAAFVGVAALAGLAMTALHAQPKQETQKTIVIDIPGEGTVQEPQGGAYTAPKNLNPKLARVILYRPALGTTAGVAHLQINGQYHICRRGSRVFADAANCQRRRCIWIFNCIGLVGCAAGIYGEWRAICRAGACAVGHFDRRGIHPIRQGIELDFVLARCAGFCCQVFFARNRHHHLGARFCLHSQLRCIVVGDATILAARVNSLG